MSDDTATTGKMDDKCIEAVADKVIAEGHSPEAIEWLFKPVTVGELMVRLFGLGDFGNVLDQAFMSTWHDRRVRRYAYNIIDREKIYRAIKRRMDEKGTEDELPG